MSSILPRQNAVSTCTFRILRPAWCGNVFPWLCVLTVLLAPPTRGDILLVQEDFTRTDGSVLNATAVVPGPGPGNWVGSTGFTAQGNVLRSEMTGTFGHMISLDFGTDYFLNNPGIYTVTADVFFDSSLSASTANWQLGFGNSDNGGVSPGSNRNLVSTTTGGEPAIFLRGNGRVEAKRVIDSTVYQSALGAYAAGNLHTLKLVLNTSNPVWSSEAYVNGVALDMNGADPGTTNYYDGVVPGNDTPVIRYLSIASNIDSANRDLAYLDSLRLSMVVIPGPATIVLFMLSGLAFLLNRRKFLLI